MTWFRLSLFHNLSVLEGSSGEHLKFGGNPVLRAYPYVFMNLRFETTEKSDIKLDRNTRRLSGGLHAHSWKQRVDGIRQLVQVFCDWRVGRLLPGCAERGEVSCFDRLDSAPSGVSRGRLLIEWAQLRDCQRRYSQAGCGARSQRTTERWDVFTCRKRQPGIHVIADRAQDRHCLVQWHQVCARRSAPAGQHQPAERAERAGSREDATARLPAAHHPCLRTLRSGSWRVCRGECVRNTIIPVVESYHARGRCEGSGGRSLHLAFGWEAMIGFSRGSLECPFHAWATFISFWRQVWQLRCSIRWIGFHSPIALKSFKIELILIEFYLYCAASSIVPSVWGSCIYGTATSRNHQTQ